jgi:hypothetical protein
MILKYVDTGQPKGRWVKHIFYSEKHNYSICGVGVHWYSYAQWQMDEEGLKFRKLCGRCRQLTERHDSIRRG